MLFRIYRTSDKEGERGAPWPGATLGEVYKKDYRGPFHFGPFGPRPSDFYANQVPGLTPQNNDWWIIAKESFLAYGRNHVITSAFGDFGERWEREVPVARHVWLIELEPSTLTEQCLESGESVILYHEIWSDHKKHPVLEIYDDYREG